MVLPSIEEDDPEAHANRWASMRTVLPHEWRMRIWFTWIVTGLSAAVLSLLVLVTILLRRRLRTQIVNQFVVGLTIPNFIFSFLCCITCTLHFHHGKWFGGDWLCAAQSVYCLYGFAACIWMYMLIARELHRMAMCPLQLKTYHPLPTAVVVKRIVVVQLLAFAFGLLSVVPLLPVEAARLGGVACLPAEYDIPSTIWHWGFTMNIMIALPLGVLIYYFGHVYRLMVHEAEGTCKDIDTVKFFVILLAVFMICWGGTGVLVWSSRIHEVLDLIAGNMSHIQGSISAIIFLAKADIREELRQFCSMVGKPEGTLQQDAKRDSVSTTVTDATAGSDGSLSSAAVRNLCKSLATEMRSKILSLEQASMSVIELQTWIRIGHFPRSHEQVTRAYRETDKVVFISHRWLDVIQPDNGDKSKYKAICQGLQQLVSKHRLKPQDVVVWVDWACIDQDDHGALQKGVASLITYVARSDYILIPVVDEEVSRKESSDARHVSSLRNYGERAWCRLEIYVFSCLTEVAGRPANIYSYTPQDSQSCSGIGRGLLQRMATRFDSSRLPSHGEVSFEADRAVVQSVEEEMRYIYVRNAVLKEQLHLQSSNSRRTARLQERQIGSQHIPLLAGALLQPNLASHLCGLLLDGNLLSAEGVDKLFSEVICSSKTPALHFLSLSNNPHIGIEGTKRIAESLSSPTCVLEELRLGSCDLDGQATHHLAEALRQPCMLRKLDLAYNRIDEEAAIQLFEAAGGHEDPRVSLDLEGNRISVQLFQQVSRARRLLELGLATMGNQAAKRRDEVAEDEVCSAKLYTSFSPCESSDSETSFWRKSSPVSTCAGKTWDIEDVIDCDGIFVHSEDDNVFSL